MVSAYRKEPIAPSYRACFLRLLVVASLGLAPVGVVASEDAAPHASGVPSDMASASAAASRWMLPPANLARRSAVLGGQSRMEQILVGQGSQVIASASSAAPAAAFAAVQAPSFASPGPERRREPAADKPDVFGSVALAVSRTPLDGQWRRATASSGARRLAAWTSTFAPAGDDDEALLRAVNRWVNARIEFTDDVRIDGQADRWASAAESLRRRRGDCEDYALAKMQLLAALGFDQDRLFLVLVRDLVRRADHAVLVVQMEDRFVVLDNMTDEVIESGAIQDYRPVLSYSWNGRWLHGYPARRPEPQPIQIAATLTALTP